MELLELLYIALGTIGILVVLHIGTFWVSRIIQPPKPKVVYIQAPQPAPQPVQQHVPQPPPQQQAPPTLSQAAPSIQLPTYEVPPGLNPENTSSKPPMGSLPPPIETRNATKQSSGDLGAPR